MPRSNGSDDQLLDKETTQLIADLEGMFAEVEKVEHTDSEKRMALEVLSQGGDFE